MPEWEKHDKIAEMMGVPYHISVWINRAIDDKNPPSEFEKYNNEDRICFSRSKVKHSIRQIYSFVQVYGKRRTKLINGCLHDRCQDYKLVKMDLKWFLETNRIEYIKPYYLHFIVDYINDRDMPNETAADVADIWEKRRGCKYMIPETQTYKNEVLDFVRNNSKIIDEIIHPFKDSEII